MPLRTRVSLVNNGAVTSKDPSMLGEGEVIRTQDGEYRPNDPGVHQILGRTEFNSAAEAAPIRAVRFLEFDNAAKIFVTLMGTEYRIADAALTGSFSSLATGIDALADTLGSTTLNDVHYLANGKDRARAVSDDKSMEFQGMLQNAVTATVSNTGSGTGFTLRSGQKIHYWIEERIKDADGNVTRRNGGVAALWTVLTGTGALVKPVITRPAKLNAEATHWAAFGTASMGTGAVGNFVGAEIGEADFDTTALEDTRTGTDPLIPSGSIYETVVTVQAGQTFIVPKWGPVPIATTIETFQDSIVMNDIVDRAVVVFSFFDEPHAMPALNVFRFNTKEYDEVVAIRAMDNFIMVLLRDALWKVTSLPRPEDSVFSPERFKVQIDGAFGCVSAKAQALFTFGTGLRLGYVSPVGIVLTDGTGWDVLTDDLDWENTVEVSLLWKSRLINNRAKYRLEFTFVPKGGTRATEQMFLNYHPSHGKISFAGGLKSKVNWPIRRDANDTVMATLNGVYESFSANEDGKLYHHDSGDTEPVTAGGIRFEVETGDIHLAGVTMQAIIRKGFVHHSAAEGEMAELGLVQRNEGQDEETQFSDVPLDFRETTKSSRQGKAEAVRYIFRKIGGTSVRVDFFGAIFDPIGTAKGQ